MVSSDRGVLGSVVTGLSGPAKGALGAGGGIFETAAKGIADPKAPYLRFDGFRGGEFIRFSQRHGIKAGPKPVAEHFRTCPRSSVAASMTSPRSPRTASTRIWGS
uniref:Uncharacterized protein n=1 Tax=Streptomyces sp. NBC_00003 TaxID=2903608 RepID=A0AAU2V0M2_9ACTN